MNLTLDEQEAKQTPIVSEREREMASGVHGPLAVASRAPGLATTISRLDIKFPLKDPT